MLSSAQRRVLEKMADGTIATMLTGRDPSAFLRQSMETVRLDTLHALRRRGYVAWVRDEVSGRDYAITPAGRQALQETDGDG